MTARMVSLLLVGALCFVTVVLGQQPNGRDAGHDFPLIGCESIGQVSTCPTYASRFDQQSCGADAPGLGGIHTWEAHPAWTSAPGHSVYVPAETGGPNAPYVNRGCGVNGGWAMWSLFHSKLPYGWGIPKWIFGSRNGANTGSFTWDKNGKTAVLTGALIGGGCNFEFNDICNVHLGSRKNFDLTLYLVEEAAVTPNHQEDFCTDDTSTWTRFKLDPTRNSSLVGRGMFEGLEVILEAEVMRQGIANIPTQITLGNGGSTKNEYFGLQAYLHYKDFVYDLSKWKNPAGAGAALPSIDSFTSHGGPPQQRSGLHTIIAVTLGCVCECQTLPSTTGVASVTTGVASVTTGVASVTTGVASVTTGVASVTTEVASVTTGAESVTTGVASATTGVVPLTTGAASVTTGVAPVTTGVASVTTGVASVTTGVAARTTGVAPVTTGVAPVTTGVAPDTTGVASVTTNVASITTGVASATTAVASITTGLAAIITTGLISTTGTPPITACGNGVVEPGEQCEPGFSGLSDPGQCCYANCTWMQSGTVCRGSVEECDLPDTCDASGACVENFKPAGTACGGAIGLCDVLDRAAVCNGTSIYCPTLPLLFEGRYGSQYLNVFNAISFNDFIADTGDVEGRVAVKRNFQVGVGYSIGEMTCTGQSIGGSCCDIPMEFALVVGCNASWGSGNLIPNHPGSRGTVRAEKECNSPPEDAAVGGTFTAPTDLTNRHTFACPNQTCGCFDPIFDAAHSYFVDLQATWGNPSLTNTFYDMRWGAIRLHCNDPDATRYYATIDSRDLSAATWWDMSNFGKSCRFGAEWIININGTGNVTITGGDTGAGIIQERAVFNILGQNRWVFLSNTELRGNLLMPDNVLDFPTGVIYGIVVAGDIRRMNQINRPSCGNFKPVKIETQAGSESPLGEAFECKVPSDTILVLSFGQFLPGDRVTVGVGSITEQATIAELLLFDGAYPALRFTAPLSNDYFGSTPIITQVDDPAAKQRLPVVPTPATCGSGESTTTTNTASGGDRSQTLILLFVNAACVFSLVF